MNFRTFVKLIMKMAMLLSITVVQPPGVFAQPQTIECGVSLPAGYFRLDDNLECGAGTSPAITATNGTVLDLNGYTINCKRTERDGIVLTGTGAVVFDGTITGCRDGVKVTGKYNLVIGVAARHNTLRGFHVDAGDMNQFVNCVAEENRRQGFNAEGLVLTNADVDRADANHFVNCVANENGRHGFKILRGNGNHIRHSEALNSCRDGIEIEAGDWNSVVNNRAEDNGNEATCARFGEAYRPWFYAGIDILTLSGHNKVINNESTGNSGCILAEGETSCVARERNLWDENVENGTCDSTNKWINNRADGKRIAPECTPGP